jgi:hypothetical protein
MILDCCMRIHWLRNILKYYRVVMDTPVTLFLHQNSDLQASYWSIIDCYNLPLSYRVTILISKSGYPIDLDNFLNRPCRAPVKSCLELTLVPMSRLFSEMFRHYIKMTSVSVFLRLCFDMDPPVCSFYMVCPMSRCSGPQVLKICNFDIINFLYISLFQIVTNKSDAF